MIELVVTGAGTGLCDSILETIDSIEGDYCLRLIDAMESAGEARRFQGRTLVIELDSEADLESADLVFDLNQTYSGHAVAFRPNLSLLPMLGRVLMTLEAGDLKMLHGVVGEPAVEHVGGVEALASQVTELFNGRDPNPEPFGGMLAFNARTLDESCHVDALRAIDALSDAVISIERLQTDSFYTVHASLWLQACSSTVANLILGFETEAYTAGLSVSPDSGRVAQDEGIRVSTRRVADDWVHMMLTADLEKTIWAQEAKTVLVDTLGKLS
ncbi:MAG: hypothetical protein CMD99_06140 [Gammaproteobacteria bacterium]|nr:hypothetical protein [Gammaproteobacteria bacterium]